VEDILRRLGSVETCVMDLKTEVAFIAANMPHLATAKSVSDLRTEMKDSMSDLKSELVASDTALKSEVSRIGAVIPHLATADSVSRLESSILKWFVGTAITLTALAFSIAKFVH
jgi:hypothetical protein